MRKTGLIVLMLCSIWLLSAQNHIEKITVNGSNLIVTRVVVALSGQANWSYRTDLDKHVVYLAIRNCAAGNPIIEGVNSGTLVNGVDSEIKGKDVTVTLGVNGPFYIETLKLEEPFRIVIDLFKYKRHYSYQEQLAQAAFYEKSGKFYAAGKQFAQIRRDFPQATDAYYLWAKLLIKQQNYLKAAAWLKKVPMESGYYKSAQDLMTKLNNKNYTALEETIEPKPDSVIQAVKPVPVPVAPAKKVHQPVVKEKLIHLLTYLTVEIAFLPVWAWLLILIVLVTAYLILLDFLRHHRENGSKRSNNKMTLIKDDSIKARMVQKLLENGWNEAEIARELQLDTKEVKHYAKQAR